MIDLKKTKEMIREMKAYYSFSKSEASQLSIIVDRVTDGKDSEAIQLAHDIAAEIALKGLAVKKLEGFLRGVEERHE